MSVVGYVGLMGSGKTRLVVGEGLAAQKAGREVFANFKLGGRRDGYLVPMCGASIHYAVKDHDAERYEFRERHPLLDSYARDLRLRRGRGFVVAPDVKVLSSWSQLEALRVHRDELGRSHRTRLVEVGTDSRGEALYEAERDCAVWDCEGCSKGITVLIDELNLWAPSRLWEQLGLGVLQRWAYARKDGLDIVWSAQHEARVDKVAREVTEHIWSCNAMGGSTKIRGRGFRFQIFRRQKFVPALMTDKNRTMATEGARTGLTDFSLKWVVRVGSNLATREEDAYDTFEHVQGSGHLSSSRYPRAGGVPAKRGDGAGAGVEPFRLRERGNAVGRSSLRQRARGAPAPVLSAVAGKVVED